jgi:hypothetical protein
MVWVTAPGAVADDTPPPSYTTQLGGWTSAPPPQPAVPAQPAPPVQPVPPPQPAQPAKQTQPATLTNPAPPPQSAPTTVLPAKQTQPATLINPAPPPQNAPTAKETLNLPKIASYAYGAKDPALSRAVAVRLITRLVNSDRYSASEQYREFFEYVAAWHVNSPAPISVGQFKQFGQQFGVDYVCVAEVAAIFGEERIFSHIIDVKTAKIAALGTGNTPLNKPSDLAVAAEQVVAALLNTVSPAPLPTPPAVPPQYALLSAQFAKDTQPEPTAAARDAGRKTRPARKTKHGFSLGYVYWVYNGEKNKNIPDNENNYSNYYKDAKIFQLGFTQTRPITQRLVSFAWEINVWGGPVSILKYDSARVDSTTLIHDNFRYEENFLTGGNIPLLCRLDLSVLFVESGVQFDGFFDGNKSGLFNAGFVAGAGVSYRETLRLYYRFGAGTAYYSHTAGIRVLF